MRWLCSKDSVTVTRRSFPGRGDKRPETPKSLSLPPSSLGPVKSTPGGAQDRGLGLRGAQIKMPQSVSFCRTGPAQGLHVMLTDEVPRKPSEVRVLRGSASPTAVKAALSTPPVWGGGLFLPSSPTSVVPCCSPSLGTGLEVLAWVSWVEP